jgi:hypothetical protein
MKCQSYEGSVEALHLQFEVARLFWGTASSLHFLVASEALKIVEQSLKGLTIVGQFPAVLEFHADSCNGTEPLETNDHQRSKMKRWKLSNRFLRSLRSLSKQVVWCSLRCIFLQWISVKLLSFLFYASYFMCFFILFAECWSCRIEPRIGSSLPSLIQGPAPALHSNRFVGRCCSALMFTANLHSSIATIFFDRFYGC